MSYAQAAAKSTDVRSEAELLASTRRSLAEADEISNRTLGTLNHQTEQLHRIQADTDAIDHNLDQSEWLIRGLRPFGWVRNLFKKEPLPASLHDKASPSSASASAGSKAPSAPSAASAGGYPGGGPGRPAASGGGGYPVGGRGAARLLADEAARRPAQAAGGRSAELGVEASRERAYDEIDHMLEGLKHKSKEINRTLDHHNDMIPAIADNVSRDQERIRKQQQDLRKLMR
mmetsp:Transcript_55365/g.121525  ORF Transcript_55365/g.121525 Transcript_55365/m.121525 type:complete len:231 (-) Transcript_55365:56-748(-)